MSNSSDPLDSERRRPSREDIETFCILQVVGPGSLDIAQLPVRLGLSHAHAGALEEAIAPLVERGWLARDENEICVTEAGSKWAAALLTAAGVA
jgi:coproporphyrinogen III oxidase-like Fe-S oxidoreductase